jgi:hypothetical protein
VASIQTPDFTKLSARSPQRFVNRCAVPGNPLHGIFHQIIAEPRSETISRARHINEIVAPVIPEDQRVGRDRLRAFRNWPASAACLSSRPALLTRCELRTPIVGRQRDEGRHGHKER